jgi:hypothetical protein
MRATAVTIRIEQFLVLIRPHLDAHTEAVLLQSLYGWISAYHYLQVIRGGYSPQAMAYMREHFYTFATALLNHMVDTFCHYFGLPWPCTEVPHTRLTRVFPALCAAQQLQGDTAGLHAYMRDLEERIRGHGTAGPAQDAAWQEEPGATTPPAPLLEVLSCIDQYIMAMLHLFEQNRERAVLRSTPPPQ